MMIPQIILIVFLSLVVLLTAYGAGESNDSPSFWRLMIFLAVIIGLLIWGGFFDRKVIKDKSVSQDSTMQLDMNKGWVLSPQPSTGEHD